MASKANSQDSSQLEFDARILSTNEKRVVQAALAFSGDYVGLLDGAWGRGSQNALEAYTIRQTGTAKPKFTDLIPLLKDFEFEWSQNNWSMSYFPSSDTSYAHPYGLLHPTSANVLSFRTEDDSLNLIVDVEGLNGALAVHSYFKNKALAYPEPYQTLKPVRLITSVSLPTIY